jgi:trehalose 6-phosphate phosphatase
VWVAPSLVALLGDLHRASKGSLALVSGRSIDSLDRLFSPFRGVAIGLHGLEMRRHPDESAARPPPDTLPAPLREAIEQIASRHTVTLVEDKGATIAVHHHLPAPAMQALRRALREACERLAPHWSVMRGRRVFEVKPSDASKARGVNALMAEPPFLGSRPIAFGDDVTDLDMFEAIRRHDGTAVAVGPRIAGRGDLQLDAPEESLALLRDVRDALDDGADALRIGEVLRTRAHA